MTTPDPENRLNRGATAALDLLLRGMTVTEDETSAEEHAEGILAAIKEGGIALAIRREIEFEKNLDIEEEPNFVRDTYGAFPAHLAAIAKADETPR